MKRPVHTSVKNEQLIEKRRAEMIRGSVQLFKQKGFHRTTTREIAQASGFSIGTLYEYIRTKEDVLYLVCDYVYDQVKSRLQQIDVEQGTIENVKLGIRSYFYVMNEMQDEVLVMYQEAASLSEDVLPYILQKEEEMAGILKTLLQRCVDCGVLDMNPEQIHLAAQNIFMQGHMWVRRRGSLQKSMTIDHYIKLQTAFLLSGMNACIKKTTPY